MFIRSEFSIEFNLPQTVPMIGLLRLFPALDAEHRAPEKLRVEHLEFVQNAPPVSSDVPVTDYTDSFGNRCSRFLAPWGSLRITGESLLEREFLPDDTDANAEQHNIEDLPTEVLQFLLSSRYCQVDNLSLVAGDLFGHTKPGWGRAIAIRDWVHDHVRFNYGSARPTKTALDVFTERVGVCRDFQHLAVTMSRAMNIPARYVTGYLGDIRRPYSGAGDFSAWYEVYLGGRWYPMDARHNDGRIGRVLMAVGRDATDVAITTSFGVANLTRFYVESFEVDEQNNPVPLPKY